jgi:hypothetical protein
MANTVRYEYSDGSANRYIVTQDSIQYIPVKLEESSTGFYSGGEPAHEKITSEQFNDVQKLFEDAINKPEIQIEDRMKTSGLVVKIIPTGSKTIILKPGISEIAAIESALKDLIKR